MAAVWWNEEKDELQWYLGIASETVDANNQSEKIKISYFYRSGQSASSWKFPETAQEIETPFSNILHLGSLLDMNAYQLSNVLSILMNWRKLKLFSRNI